MTDSSRKPSGAPNQMTRQVQNIGIGTNILAVIMATIGVILLGVDAFDAARDAASVSLSGFYFVGAAGILASISSVLRQSASDAYYTDDEASPLTNQ